MNHEILTDPGSIISREEDLWLWKIGNDQPNIPYEEKLSDTLNRNPP
jgi:hypothetical protein